MFKKILYLSPVVLIVFLFSLPVSTVSCKKDTLTVIKKDTVTVTVIQRDTVILHAPDTTLTPAILTANSWKVREDRAMLSNSSNYLYYLRGGSSNTINLDNEYITFNVGGTGLYTDNGGVQTTFTWNFTDASNTKLVWIWNHPTGPITITWENIIYQGGGIRYTEFYTIGGVKNLSSITRIPR
jgi:hypothetical protein